MNMDLIKVDSTFMTKCCNENCLLYQDGSILDSPDGWLAGYGFTMLSTQTRLHCTLEK